MTGSTRRARSAVPPARQAGLTITALVVWLVPVIILLLIVIKVVPAYYEHRKIQEILHSMDESGQTKEASDRELRTAFERRAEVDEIHSVVGADLVIDKVMDRKIIHVDYAAKIPLMDQMSLVIEFSASSAPGAGSH